MKPIQQETIKNAIWLMKDGFSMRETAKRLNISKSTVAKIRFKDKENMEKDNGGRPRKITAETTEHLKLNMKRGVLRTSIYAMKEANRLLPQPVSVTTVRRRLREAGIIAKKIMKRPALKQQHINGQLQF
ncbi:hypothetical protein BGX24_007508, partial [Mortierella sp. AD032]